MSNLSYPRAAVLGCGPAGLMAAEGLSRQGWEVDVLSSKKPSVITGAQFLHVPIPGVTSESPNLEVEFFKVGTKEGYAKKVYGNPYAPCSWDLFPEGKVPAWSMLYAYTRLWNDWGSRVRNCILNSRMIEGMEKDYNLIISTIPAWMLCQNPHVHNFRGQPISIENGGVSMLSRDQIIYNGLPEAKWYRTSLINGHGSTEYANSDVRFHSARLPKGWGMKPISHNCDCLPNIVRMGRFGKWQKGVLVHNVWEEVMDALYAV